jgi:hypothetical protein
VEIEPEAEDEIRAAQERMTKKYVPDVPLCEPSTLLLKIARLSVAVAARLFSNRDRETVLVRKDHVECAEGLMDMAYSKRAMSYLAKSQAIIRDQEIVKANTDATGQYLVERFPDPKERASFINCMLRMGQFTKSELSEFVNLGKEDFNAFFKNLTMNRMLEKRGPQWAKSVHFTELLRKMDAESDWNPEDRPRWPAGDAESRAHEEPMSAPIPEWLSKELDSGKGTDDGGESK